MRSDLRQMLAEAFEPTWFKEMTKREQDQYLKDHPGSKLNPSFHPATQPVRHPSDHPKVVESLKPHSPERRAVARQVTTLGKGFTDYYAALTPAQRMDVKKLTQKVAQNRPLKPKELGRLAGALNRYQAWAKGLDEKKVGYGVLKGLGAAGALALAATPAGQVGLSLGALLLAGYGVHKGLSYVRQAMQAFDDPSPRVYNSTNVTNHMPPQAAPTAAPPLSTSRPPAPSPSDPALPSPDAEVIPPRLGPRPGDHLAALASYFRGEPVNEETARFRSKKSNPNLQTPQEMLDDMDSNTSDSFDLLFRKLSDVAKTAHLSPEQWKPLLAYTRRRF